MVNALIDVGDAGELAVQRSLLDGLKDDAMSERRELPDQVQDSQLEPAIIQVTQHVHDP